MKGWEIAALTAGGALLLGGVWYIVAKSGTVAQTQRTAGSGKSKTVQVNSAGGKSDFQATVQTVGQVADLGKSIVGLFGKSSSDDDSVEV